MSKKKTEIKDENYYQISGWMVKPDKLNLSGLELSVYAIIYGFSQARDNCYHNGTTYLADFTGATDRGVRKAIKSLISKGLLVEKRESYQVYSYVAVVPDFDEYNQNKKTKREIQEPSSSSDEQSSPADKNDQKNDELSSADDELSSADDELSSADDELSSADGELSSADGELSSTHNIYNNLNNIYTTKSTDKNARYLFLSDCPNVNITLSQLRFLNRYYETKSVTRALQRLNKYIQDTGHTFKSHLDVLEKWINEDMVKI